MVAQKRIWFTEGGILQVPSNVLMGISDGSASSKETVSFTPFGAACSRRDLTAILEILEKVGYKEDEEVANEVIHCFFRFLFLVEFN